MIRRLTALTALAGLWTITLILYAAYLALFVGYRVAHPFSRTV